MRKTVAKTSITGRLILTLTAGTTVLWVIAAAVSSGVLQHELTESFDRAEMETAQRLLPLATDSALDREEGGDQAGAQVGRCTEHAAQ